MWFPISSLAQNVFQNGWSSMLHKYSIRFDFDIEMPLTHTHTHILKCMCHVSKRAHGIGTGLYQEKQPQRPWPKDHIWTFKSSPQIFGSPMFDAVLNKSALDREMLQWLKSRPFVFQAMWDRWQWDQCICFCNHYSNFISQVSLFIWEVGNHAGFPSFHCTALCNLCIHY